MTASLEQLPRVVQPHEVDAFAREDGGVKIIDVRTPAEFESIHIPGSYNVPLDQLAEHREAFVSVCGPIVLVCRTGLRARQAETLLHDVGIPRLHILDGGVTAWQQAGLPVVRGRQTWSIERQVRAIAGALVLLGTLGSLLLWAPLIYLAMVVGVGLFFAGLTDTCAMGMLLLRLPWNRDATCDVVGVLARLEARTPEEVSS